MSTTLEAPHEAPAFRPSIHTTDAAILAHAEVIDDIGRVERGPVPMPGGGSTKELGPQLAEWRERFRETVRLIPRLGGDARAAQVRRAAVLAVQIRRTQKLYDQALESEREAERRKQQAEDDREARLRAEITELRRLERICFGQEQP